MTNTREYLSENAQRYSLTLNVRLNNINPNQYKKNKDYNNTWKTETQRTSQFVGNVFA